jgi:hypothetical protein
MEKKLIKYLQIDPKQIIRATKTGQIYLAGQLASKEEIKSLQEEIKFLEKTRFWEIVTNYIAEQAKLVMFEKAESFDDMRVGKAMLLNLSFIESIKNMIKKTKV